MSIPFSIENSLYSDRRLSWLGRIEGISGEIVGGLAAAIILFETVLLAMGVFARYVLHSPIFWGDELALILFAWLSMFGAVLALRNAQHMKLTFIVDKLSPARQVQVRVFTWTLLTAVITALLIASWNYTTHSWIEKTPALQVSVGYRAAAITVGFGLMLITCLARLQEIARLSSLLWSALIIGVIAAAFWYSQSFFNDIGNYSLIFFFVVLVLVCIAAGIEIALTFALATLAYIGIMTHAPFSIVINRLDAAISDFVLLSIPLFIFVGVLLEATGLSKALIELMVKMLGHVKGGFHYVLIAAMYLVSGISGSKSADMAAIAPILLPEMKRRGNNEGETVALLSVSGAMAETIPPSIILIAVGVSSGVSIASLFVSGLVPALLGLIALGAVVFFRHRKSTAVNVERASKKEILKALFYALPALMLPLLIRAAVVEGVATATEVATVGVVYSIVCGLVVYRQFPLKRIYRAMIATASLTGAIMLVTGLAGGMAWALTQSGFSDDLMSMMQNLPGGWIGFILFSIVFFALLGSILEGFPAIVLFAPLMFPIAHEFGIHGVHYAMVVVLSMSIGLFSPPFGVGFYSACAIGRVAPDKVMKDIWVYMFAFILVVIVVALVPWFSVGLLKDL
ncbi:TRAP transporter large permease [Pantoea cypripedii]|uniref:ABC transporter permease n=1 Tax=Pantoea cypripedii TaxID=55209 RepID=A0A6B9GAU8_PANCY|nr:TRAP transporter large permease subunit [Pantoea cypripedii]QGY32963.1 ABC transporter permease [Pantoea cypripedii]